jgi:broad specificity phosphatase PhoE
VQGERRPQVVLVRHGETEWTKTGQHTGTTDIDLTETGRRQAERLGTVLSGRHFATVLTSPLLRAAETCRLAGLADAAEVRDDLAEWDYGAYEGRTTRDIRAERPGWSLWDDGVPGGESADDVGQRADRLIAELRSLGGDVAVFSHGHLLRVMAARWVGLPPGGGKRLALHTATISVLGYERETRVLVHWNQDCEPALR